MDKRDFTGKSLLEEQLRTDRAIQYKLILAYIQESGSFLTWLFFSNNFHVRFNEFYNCDDLIINDLVFYHNLVG